MNTDTELWIEVAGELLIENERLTQKLNAQASAINLYQRYIESLKNELQVKDKELVENHIDLPQIQFLTGILKQAILYPADYEKILVLNMGDVGKGKIQYTEKFYRYQLVGALETAKNHLLNGPAE